MESRPINWNCLSDRIELLELAIRGMHWMIEADTTGKTQINKDKTFMTGELEDLYAEAIVPCPCGCEGYGRKYEQKKKRAGKRREVDPGSD